MTGAIVITGIPGAGKSTVAEALARRLGRAAHIEAEEIQRMIVSGGLWPDEQPREEAMLQLRERAEHTAALARSICDAGFVAVIADIIVVPERLAIYQRALAPHPVELITLAPAIETALARDHDRAKPSVGDRFAHLDAEQRTALSDTGLWIDTTTLTVDDTVERILAWPPAVNVLGV